jgi:FkbM family methyltransferase
MTLVAERPSRFKTFARSVLPRPARNWLRSPVESAHYVYDEGLFCLGMVRRHEIRPGWRLTAHPGAFRMAFWAQVHDPEQVSEFDRFVSACRPDMVFFDVGAHFGLFCLAALHYGPSALCVAIEPSEFAGRMLRLHATLNYPERRLLIRRAAAGRSLGTARMVDVGIQARGYFITADDSRPAGDVTLVPSVTVDALAAEYGMEPTHLKIDVEGDEASVLAGAAATLTAAGGRRPTVFLELHNDILRSRGAAPAQILTTLIAWGYRLEAPSGAPLTPDTAVRPALTRLVASPRE